MKENLTEIVFILDKSGSMGGLEEATIEGYNDLLEKQRATEGEAVISTILFNDKLHIIKNRVDIKEVAPLTSKEYVVEGTTALCDAIGTNIDRIGALLSETREDYHPSKVIFIIITDGMENASRQFSYPMIAKMIEHQKEKYGWEFIFFGANFDAESFAKTINIDIDFAMTFDNTNEGIKNNYHRMNYLLKQRREFPNHKIDKNWKEKVTEDN